MSALNKIAYFQNRRDEVPNRELAKQLAETKDCNGIREIAENLWNDNNNVHSDCEKVLYEIGYLDPELVAGYVGDFLKLLKSKDNRLVWGGMLALSTIAGIKAEELYQHYEEITRVMEQGSVITRDNGVKILATISSRKDEYRERILFLLTIRNPAGVNLKIQKKDRAMEFEPQDTGHFLLEATQSYGRLEQIPVPFWIVIHQQELGYIQSGVEEDSGRLFIVLETLCHLADAVGSYSP